MWAATDHSFAFPAVTAAPGTKPGGTPIHQKAAGPPRRQEPLEQDTVNVAARVEQLTKTTGDTILLTHQCVNALAFQPLGLIDRGSHSLKGKSATVQVFGLNQEPTRVGF